MANGYHSRSPEEFRQYVKSLNKDSKTKTWRNVLIFIDILLLLLVLYMASKKINPSVNLNYKSSNRIINNEMQIYASKSSNSPPDSVGYFLFVANKSSVEKTFGRDLKIILSVQSETGTICHKKEFILTEKRINPGISENFSFFFEKIPELELAEDCKSVYKKPAFPRTIDTIFKKKYRIDTHLFLEEKDGERKELVFTDDNW